MSLRFLRLCGGLTRVEQGFDKFSGRGILGLGVEGLGLRGFVEFGSGLGIWSFVFLRL